QPSKALLIAAHDVRRVTKDLPIAIHRVVECEARYLAGLIVGDEFAHVLFRAEHRPARINPNLAIADLLGADPFGRNGGQALWVERLSLLLANHNAFALRLVAGVLD